MTDATILIPTFRHVQLLPYAVRSALDQRGATIELFVVGDGVEDETRAVLEPFTDDPRLRFFDFPKSPRRGEPHRHRVLEEASGRIVTYLCDDDVLLRDHCAEMSRLLEDADFAHPPPVWVDPSGTLHLEPFDVGQPAFVELARTRGWSFGLTGTSHTLEAYRRLPYGWRTTPQDLPTDHYMWLQWFELPDLRAVAGRKPTHLHFPSPKWDELEESTRAAALAEWFGRSREPGFADEVEELLVEATWRAAEARTLHEQLVVHELGNAYAAISALESTVSALQSTQSPPQPDRLSVPRRLRALFGRRPEAR
jgi:glycosyltransferase involved in cell wall biosynthesis